MLGNDAAVDSHQDSVIKKFNEWALAGDGQRMEDSHTPFAKQGFDCLKLKDGETYLDIGCGSGYSVGWASASRPKTIAVGIDASPEMVKLAKKNFKHNPQVSFFVENWPGKIASQQCYDAIFSMEVFYYLADLNRAIEAVYKALNPGGRFACLVDFYQEHLESHCWREKMNLSMHLLSMNEWAYELQRVGFTNILSTQLISPEKPEFVGTLLTLGIKP